MHKNKKEFESCRFPATFVEKSMRVSWFDSLQKRWGITSPFQVVVILTVFAATGISVLYLKKWLLPFMGVHEDTATWLRILISIFVILPIYQVVLLFYGTIFGQFAFFWAFEKRMLGRIAKFFTTIFSKV